jgi:hypothetical protein
MEIRMLLKIRDEPKIIKSKMQSGVVHAMKAQMGE